MAITDAGDSSCSPSCLPPARSMAVNAQRSAAVDTSMPAAFAIAGGPLHRAPAQVLRYVGRGETGRFLVRHAEGRVHHAEGLEHAGTQDGFERLPTRPLEHDAEHLGAGVVAPTRTGLVEQRERGEARDPLVGPEGRRWPG